mgnify:CR=1 FL=1
MAKVEKILLHSFEKPLEPTMKVDLPEGWKLLKISAYPDGLYLWAEIPSITVPNFNIIKFHNLSRDTDIPANCSYFTTIEIFTEEGVMIFHVYKYNS